MVAILTAPRGPRASSPAAGSRTGFLGTRIAEPGQGAGEGRADGTGRLSPVPTPRQDPDLAAGESDDADPSHLRLDPAAAAVAKPRRSKARTRKAAKPAAEPAPEFAPVTWIRVGPGKYVRSDAIIQGQPPAEAPPSAVASDADPATDPPEPATAAPTDADPAAPAADVPDAAALTSEEPATTAHPATDAHEAAVIPTLECEAPEAHPTSDAPEPAPEAPEVVTDASPTAEEYGIAPSAFGPTSPERDPVESRDPVASDPIEPILSESEPGRTADPGATAPGPVRPPIGRMAGGDGRGRVPASSRSASPMCPRPRRPERRPRDVLPRSPPGRGPPCDARPRGTHAEKTPPAAPSAGPITSGATGGRARRPAHRLRPAHAGSTRAVVNTLAAPDRPPASTAGQAPRWAALSFLFLRMGLRDGESERVNRRTEPDPS